MDGRGLWFYDPVEGRTTPGSTYTDLDGVESRALWSNEIFVSEGDILDMDIYTRHSGLAGPTSAIGFDVVLFNGPDPVNNLMAVVQVVSSTASTADSPDWSENLRTSYTVPASVDRIRMQLRVDKSATAGRVRFDDGTVTKRGTTIPQRLVENLPENLQDIVHNIGVGATGIIKPEEFDIPSIREVLNNLLRGVTDANAAIAEMLAYQAAAAQSGSRAVSVRFSDYPNGAVPADFKQIIATGPGNAAIRNGCLDWVDAGNQRAERVYLYTPQNLATNAFEVSIAMPRRAENLAFSGPAYNYLIGAANLAGTEFYVVRYGYNEVKFGYASGGVMNFFGPSEVAWQTPAGSTARFRGELVAGKPRFEFYVNTHRVTTYTDNSAMVTMDASHRYCGLGLAAANRVLGQATPGNVSMFLMNDPLASGTLIET
jgi:hypothetical protein